jgi:hypothetical protein
MSQRAKGWSHTMATSMNYQEEKLFDVLEGAKEAKSADEEHEDTSRNDSRENVQAGNVRPLLRISSHGNHNDAAHLLKSAHSAPNGRHRNWCQKKNRKKNSGTRTALLRTI